MENNEAPTPLAEQAKQFNADYAEAMLHEPKKPIVLPISLEELYALPQQARMNDLQVSLQYFLYLTGARISEALSVSTTDLTLTDEALVVRLFTLKKRKQGLEKIRLIPLSLAEGIEGDMARVIVKHWRYYQANRQQKLFPIHRSNAFRWCAKLITTVQAIDLKRKSIISIPEFHLHPHYYRHCRLTHLVLYHNFDIMRLKKFAGWSSYEPAETYVNLNWRDLLNQIEKTG